MAIRKKILAFLLMGAVVISGLPIEAAASGMELAGSAKADLEESEDGQSETVEAEEEKADVKEEEKRARQEELNRIRETVKAKAQEQFVLQTGEVTDSGAFTVAETDVLDACEVNWTLDDAGVLVLKTEGFGCGYIAQTDGLSEEKRNQVRTIYFDAGEPGQISCYFYGYDDRLFPNAETLVIGESVSGFFDPGQNQIDETKQNATIRRVQILSHGGVGLTRYMALEEVVVEETAREARLSLSYCEKLTDIIAKCPLGSLSLICCDALEDLAVEEIVKNPSVQSCAGLKHVYIKKWGGSELVHSFPGNASLEFVVIDEMDSETWSMAGGTFEGCASLREISIPAKLTAVRDLSYGFIGEQGCPFYGCSSLEEYPDFRYIEELGKGAFKGCVNLKEVMIKNLKNLKTGELFSGCTKLERVTLAGPGLETVTVDRDAFKDCGSLKSLDIRAEITSVGQEAFCNCRSLTDVPDFTNLASIGASAFKNCEGLSHMIVMGFLESIGEEAFYGCTGLKQIYIRQMQAWPYNAEEEQYQGQALRVFYGCTSLESIVVEELEEPVSIGREMFYNCSSLHTLIFPQGIKRINYHGFYGCGSLRSLPDLSSLESVSYAAFEGCGIEEAVFPETAKFFNDEFLGAADGQKRVFCGCSNLKRVVLPKTIDNIGEEMFYGCSSLEVIEGLEQIRSVKKDAFTGCEKLTELNLPDTVEHISSLPPGLEIFRIPNGIYSGMEADELTELFAETMNIKEVTIPLTGSEDSYKMAGAFRDHKKLEKVVFTEYASIAASCFAGCTALKEVKFSENPGGSFGKAAFSDCISLEEIELPSKVSYISASLFQGCEKLKQITLPDGLQEIGSYAFSGCKELTELALSESIEKIGNYAFSGSGLINCQIPQGVSIVPEGAFYQCEKLTEILLDQPTLYVKQGAFTENTKKISLLNQDMLTLGSGSLDTEVNVGAITGAQEVLIGSDVVNVGEHALIMGAGDANIYFLKGTLNFSGSNASVTQALEAGKENRLIVYIDPAVDTITGKLTDCDYVVIVGEAGSAAEEYAAAQGYEFQADGSSGTGNPAPGGTAAKKEGFDFKIVTNEAMESEAVITGYIGRPQLDASGRLEIPETLIGFPVTKIAKGAFASAFASAFSEKRLKSISLPASLKTVEPNFIASWLKDLTEIIVSVDNPYLCAENGVLYNKDKTELIQVMPGVTEVTIPDTVQKIGEGAFEGCGLETITLPARIKEIGVKAFYRCKNLKVVDLPRTVTTIGDMAFAYSGLRIFTAGENITEIGKDILSGTSGEYYSIPESRIAEYLKKNEQPSWELGNGAVCGDYVLGIKVKDNSDGKFMSHSKLSGYSLVFTKKIQKQDSQIKIMSVQNDRELASIPISGDPVARDDMVIPNLQLEHTLPSDTEICFMLPEGALVAEGAESSEWSSIGNWSKVTMTDRWHYPNFEESVPESVLCYMVESSQKRSDIRKAGVDGKRGICFGMSASVAMIKQGKPSVRSFDTMKEIYDIPEYAQSTDLSVTAKEFWQILQIMQLDKNVEKFRKKTRNQRGDLLNAVRKMLDGSGKPCVIYLNGKEGWHAVLPCGIEDHVAKGEGNTVDIYIYDCNPDVNECNSFLRMFVNNNDTVVQWDYYSYKNLPPQASSTMFSDIDYIEVDETFYKTVKGYKNFVSRDARTVQSDIDSGENMFDQDSRLLEVTTSLPYCISSNIHLSSGTMSGNIAGSDTDGDLLIPILPAAGETDDQSRCLYWLDENESPLEIKKLPSYMQASLTGNVSSVSADSSRESDIVMETADTPDEQTTVAVTPKWKGSFTVGIDYDSSQGKPYADSIQITGTAAETVQVRDGKDGFLVSGEQESVIMIEKDGKTAEQKVRGTDQYEEIYVILEEREGSEAPVIVMQADTDGDGEPDTVIPPDGEDPDNPDKPVDPDNPDKPVDPDNPDKPVDPVNPDQPENPDTPDNPDKPDPSGSQKVTGITLSCTSAVLFPTQRLALTVSVAPVSASDRSVSFVSMNPSVASVSPSGVIEAKAPGSAQVRVTAKDGSGITAVCNITVKAASVKLNASKAPLQIKKSSTALKVAQMEEGDQIVSWNSSKPSIVSVSSTGKLKAGPKTGKAVITVQTKFGAKASCTITAQKKKVALKSLNLTDGAGRKLNKIKLKKGRTFALIVNRNPITAAEKISFTSSSPKVAQVTKKGVVKARKKGKCKITAKSKNGKKKTISIYVE